VDKNLKPRIYKPTEKDFSHNGLGIMIDTTRCDVTEEANGKYEVEIEHPLKSRFSDYFENGYQIKAKPNDQEDYHIFEIKNTYKDTINNSILIYGQSRTYKLGNREVQHVEIDSKNGAEVMAAIEKGMDEACDVKLFSDIQTVSSTSFEARNVLNCIAGEQGSMLQYWGGEIKREPFKLSLLRRRGRDNVGIVRYGKDLNGLKIKFDWSSIVTKVLPYADLQDGDDGTSNRIYGKPIYSDLLQNYPDIYAKHIQFTEDQGVKDLASLNRVAANYFTSMNPNADKPKITIELEIEKLTDSEEAKEFSKIRNYGLFDTFSVYHKGYDIYIETKISSVTYDSLREKNKKIYAGDAQLAFYTKQNYELQETIKTLTKKGYMSEFVDYVTNLINGVEGGSVLQYPKNKPHTTYYMDTDSRDTAKDVIAINNQGLGFSRTGWLGPFVNAWGIDGTLNADFIRAGKIQTNIMEISFNGMGDLLKMVSGTLQLWNDDLKIMELTKKGLQFWSGTRSLGTIGTAGEPFPDLIDQDGPVSMDGKALMIRGDSGNDYIALSAKTGTGLILGNGKGMYLIDDNIRMIGDLVINGNVDIRNGELKIDGQKVVPGQGGGPSTGGGTGTGGYPPELTTDAEKYAWDWWSFALNNGYSEEAAAGVLGNIQGEVGSSMNPNTAQVGGPAFGWVQWDGSAYPLVGSPTWDGREYVQRLMAAAGIREDYTTSLAQAKLIEWCMYNGQWIGQVSPTTVSGFKAITSVEQAATAFELNFERPAAAHPERQGYARNWYNKLYGLQASQLVGEEGLAHLETLLGRWVGNGQCYAVPAEYSGFLGGCGLGAGTKYGLTHVIGNTSAAADIGIAYDWSAVGWQVILNPTYEQLVVGAIVNITRGAYWGGWYTDSTYGHTGVIRGLENGRIQTYEQNTEKGQIVERFDREYRGGNQISSIVIPPK